MNSTSYDQVPHLEGTSSLKVFFIIVTIFAIIGIALTIYIGMLSRGGLDQKNLVKGKATIRMVSLIFEFACVLTFLCLIYNNESMLFSRDDNRACNLFTNAPIITIVENRQYRIEDCNLFIFCEAVTLSPTAVYCSVGNAVSTNETTLLIQDSWLDDEICDNLDSYKHPKEVTSL